MEHGGYKYRFVQLQGMDGNLEDIFICKICLLPSKNPQLSVCCGHTFCKSCFDNIRPRYSRTRNFKICPVCRDKQFEVFPNKQVNRKIRSLHVFCANERKGCEWQGELNNLGTHLNRSEGGGCKYEDVECTHGCGETLQRQHITMHMEVECTHRKINCPYCSLSGIHSFITGDHKEDCPKVVIQCPNHCETNNILREDMEKHRKVCSLEVVNCKYMKLGCGARLVRKEVEEHGKEKMEEHLHLALQRVEKLDNTTSRLGKAVSQLTWLSYITSQVLDTDYQVAPIVFRITGFADNYSQRIRWTSPYFFTGIAGYEMYLKIIFARYYLKAYMSLGPNEDNDNLDWPLRGRFDVLILNQIRDKKHYSRRIVFDDRCSDETAGRAAAVSWGLSQFISYDQLCATSSTCQYVKDDTMYIKVFFSSLDVEDDDSTD